LFAVEVLEPEVLAALPDFSRRLDWMLNYRPDLAALVSHWNDPGRGQRRLLSLLRGHRMKMLLRRMLDETEFLSDYGVRSVSARHRDEPFSFECCGSRVGVAYVPGESDSGMFGGNSNWRGPIWFPMNYLLIESLRRFHAYYGDDFKVECPTGSGTMLTLAAVADELCRRLARLFLRGPDGRRPCHGDDPLYRDDPHFRDLVLFYEHFHGDTGRGLGTTHQTGWTGAVARLVQPGG
ncbi:MAG: MGH1-like glycoside hydrolase domain-containing protein, partial [Planctomycetia bacterium]